MSESADQRRCTEMLAHVVARTRRGEQATPAEMRAVFPELAEDSDEEVVAFQQRVHAAADALAHAFAHGETATALPPSPRREAMKGQARTQRTAVDHE